MSRKLLTTPAVTGTPSTQKTYIHIEERTTFRTTGTLGLSRMENTREERKVTALSRYKVQK